MSEPDTSLQQEILFALGNGMETTLLVLEMLSDPEVGPVLEEAAVLQELLDMEAAGLVFRGPETGSGKPEAVAHGNIPEYKQGRAEVVWWALTEAGALRVREEIDGLRSRTVGRPLRRINSKHKPAAARLRHDELMLDRHPIEATIATSLAALIGGMAATVAVTPEFREAGGTDVLFETPRLGLVGRGVLLGISVVAAGVVLWVLASGNRLGGSPRRTIEVTAVSVGVGVLAGLGYRIVTAKSDGANIGGGIVLLVSPFAALLFVGYVAARTFGMRASGDTR